MTSSCLHSVKNLTVSDHVHKLSYVSAFAHVFNWKKPDILCVAGTMYW